MNQTCTVTLTGAVTGSFSCLPFTVGWNGSANASTFAFSITQAGTTPGIAVAVGWAGEPTGGGAYTGSSAGASGGASVTTGTGVSAALWGALVTPATGSYTVAFTSVRNAVTSAQGKVYTADGTFDGTLQPIGTNTGTVTMHVAF